MPRSKGEGELIRRVRLEPEVQEGGLEGDWPPKWMTTYSDMTTILLTFFVLWYANKMMNIPDELVEIADEDSAEIKSGAALTQEIELNDQVSNQSKEIAENLTVRQQIALTELSELRIQAQELREFIESGELAEQVEIKITGEDIVILPGTELLFAEGSASLRPDFFPVLDKISQVLTRTNTAVRIEGHTDDIPIHPRHRRKFPSNWELSSSRAIAVGHYLINKNGISPERISVCGYGDALPRVPNNTAENRAKNRRVEFHIYATSDLT